MKFLIIPLVFLATSKLCQGGPLRLQKRAAFYIANETACVVDNTVYSSGDPIPTDDPCEACKCRPPGFACVLKDCQVKPGCRAVRRAGHCCPEYICGCEHNGRMYRDGDEIRDSKNPCYTCHCQGSSIACAFVDCLFRVDCSPEYVAGECCPRYPQCSSSSRNANSSYAAETINPDTDVVAITPDASSETSLLDESKVEYATSEASIAEEKETKVDSDSVSPFVPDATSEDIHDAEPSTTHSIPIIESHATEIHDEGKQESPDLLNTESEIKKEYVEKSGDEVHHEVLTIEVRVTTAGPTTEGPNVEIFADEVSEETTSKQEESYTTADALTTNEDAEIEANTIEKTYRALKNFTSEGDESESADEEQSESPDIEKSGAPEIEEQSKSPVIEEKSESPETEQKSKSLGAEENSDSRVTDEKSETPEIEKKLESSVTAEKPESSVIEEKPESPVIEEKSESPKNEKKSESSEIKETSDLTRTEATTASENQETTSNSVNEIKATEHSSSLASDTTTGHTELTTKNAKNLYYNEDKISTTESSEIVTALVHVLEETSPQANEDPQTTSSSENKDASSLPTSENPIQTTLSGKEKSELPN